ncbi:EF-hand domain-containing protein [Streptomyces niveus]|uniref:EF-hand domain-containing protein n=1 Tax=Streptomyces niveus TaxID=193462 RepID=UPI0036CDE97F
MTEAEAEAVFSKIDTDGNGEIRLSELRDYGKANGGSVEGIKLAEFVRGADTDGDRRITLTEFKQYFT